jgi:hypothetical protein
MDRSINAGSWNTRLELLAKRLRGRPEDVVLDALLTLQKEEQADVADERLRKMAMLISQGRGINLNQR